MPDSQSLQRTPLYEYHLARQAKMAPFAGWEMPMQYDGILAEHEHTRTKASVFDICHMGELLVRGASAAQELGLATSHNLTTLAPGKCRYGFILNERGGIIDDCIVYCISLQEYMVVVNGACEQKDFDALKQRLPASTLENISSRTAKIDLQGPASFDALSALMGKEAAVLPYFSFHKATWAEVDVLISRTGYTGELGYELYLPWDRAMELWDALLANPLTAPAGLGCRDTLRLEAGLLLYGQDIDEDHTPVEAGLSAMLTNPLSFVGKEAARNVRQSLIALKLDGRRSARHNDMVRLPDGTTVGTVTSGSFAPSLGHAVALAWIDKEHAGNANFEIMTAKTSLPAARVELPFYTQGSVRVKLP